jgi:hypothetical protein
VTREGAVVLLDRLDARGSHISFHFFEVFGFPRTPKYRKEAEVVEVDTINGRPRTRQPAYYHPRPQWLEAVETTVGGGIYTSADQPKDEA